MRVLNIFHALLITNVRTVRSKDRTVGYIIARPRLQLLLPLFTILTLAFLNPWVTGHKQCTNCVNWFTIVSRLLATLIVALLLVFDNFRQRHKVLALLQTIPSAGSVGGTRSSERYTVKRLQLSILLLCNLLSLVELLYNVYRTHVYLYIWGVFTGVIIEYYILLNSLLCQTLAETIANTYDTLQRALPVRPFSSVIDEMVVLGRCKDQLSDAIGLKLLLVMMHLLFNISFCAYDILQKVVSQAHMHNIARLTIIALQETVVLFGLCFYYSLLTLKVGHMEELKILNWFNHLCVSPIYLYREVQTDRHQFRIRNLYRNAAILTTLTVTSSVSAFLLVFSDVSSMLSSVMGIITLILYAERLVVGIPIVIWALAHSRALVDISNRALHIERQLSFDKSIKVSVRLVTQVQLFFAFLTFFFNFAFQIYYMIIIPIYRDLLHAVVLFAFMLLESVILVHLTYTQYWPVFLSNRYVKLTKLINARDRNILDRVIALGSVLQRLKQQCASIFGLMQFFHLLNIFVTCSVEWYIVLYVVDVGMPFYGVAFNFYTTIAYGTSFLIYTYAHDRINQKFFNVFNHCFVSPIYLGFDSRIGRYVFRSRNDRWNVTLLTAIVTSASFSSVTLLMELLQNQLGSVLGATTIILYAMRLLVIAPLTLWTLFKKRKLMSACNFALNIVQDQQGWLSQQTGRRRKSLRMPTGQIATIAVTLFLGLAVQAMEMWKIERLRKFHYAFNICAFVFLEFITLMHVMLVQCWTRFTSQRIEDLLWVVKRNASSELLPMVISLWEAWQSFKQHIASSFGIMNVLHALDAFVTSVVETYTVIYILELGYGIQTVFLSLTTLILYTGMYYTFASAHELLQFKLKFLNWFNHLLIAPTYLTIDPSANRYAFRNRNLYCNALILAIPLMICSVAASMILLRDIRQVLESVASATSIILHTMRLFVIMLLLAWTLVNNGKLTAGCNHALHIVTQMGDRLNCRIVQRHSLLVLTVQIYLNAVIVVLIFCFQSYKIFVLHRQMELNNIIVTYGFCLLEFYLSIHRVYVQFWATFLRLVYGELVRCINQQTSNLYTLIALLDDIESFKLKVANTFGVFQLLHIANIFFTCSTKTYILFYFWSSGYGIKDSLSNWFMIIVHLSILNVFNHLCVSLVFVEQSPKGVIVRRKHVFRNLLVLIAIVLTVCWLGATRTYHSFREMVRTVTEVVHLLKYSINAQIMYLVLSWMYQYSNQVVAICNKAIAIDSALKGMQKSEESSAEQHTLLKTLIIISILLRGCFLAMHVFLQFRFNLKYEVYVVLHCSVLVELTMDLQKIFLLHFGYYLARRYQIVVCLLAARDTGNLDALSILFEDLRTLKKSISQTFGMLLLALILQTFIACSIHAYLIIEAELKDALKSMQYRQLQKQTRDQKDFYDLVNLKLMMASPKITACGLFEINLQIFYNVFAAIITYIVILFQFRGFEKTT
uniref:Uncharacterized protein n=1 Tax=Anopheles stephensi TaxID=30069 RepID=A0A182Y2R2_ANOST